MDLGSEFRELRLRLKLSQEQCADLVGLSVGSIYKYEANKIIPRADAMRKLKELVGNENKEKDKDSDMNDFAMELARDKIESQKKEIEKLEYELKSSQRGKEFRSQVFEDITADVTETIYVKGIIKNKVMTKHTNQVGGDKLLNALGITKEEKKQYYMATGIWFPIHKHPMDELIVQESQEELHELRDMAIRIFRGLKFIMGLDSLNVNITYQYKDKIVHTHTALKFEVTYKNGLKIYTKTIVF